MRLNVQNALFGIYAACKKQRGELQSAPAQFGGVLPDRHGVHVCYGEIRIIFFLQRTPGTERTNIVAYGQVVGRLNARIQRFFLFFHILPQNIKSYSLIITHKVVKCKVFLRFNL